jgi:hypothetical protein
VEESTLVLRANLCMGSVINKNSASLQGIFRTLSKWYEIPSGCYL